MAKCKCGLSATYPECDSSHQDIINDEKLRQKLVDVYKEHTKED